MTSEDIVDRYRSYSTIELLAILQNSEEYQSIAIEAARDELKSRHLSEDELNRLLLELENRKKQKVIDQSNSIGSQIKITVKRFLTTINPFDYRHPEAERIIRATVFWNFIIYLILVFTRYKEASWILSDFARSPFLTLIGLMPFLFYPLGIIGFALRKKFGWIMLSFFLGFSTITFFWTFCQILLRFSPNSDMFGLFTDERSTTDFIIPLLIAGLTLYGISKSEVRSIFLVSKPTMFRVFVASAIAGILMVFLLL